MSLLALLFKKFTPIVPKSAIIQIAETTEPTDDLDFIGLKTLCLKIKNGIKKDLPSLSRQVALKEKFSNHFIEDLKKINII